MKIGPVQLQQYAPPGSRASVRPTQETAHADGIPVDTAADVSDSQRSIGFLKATLVAGLGLASLAGIAGMVGAQQSAPPPPHPSHQSVPARAGNEAAVALQQQGTDGEMKFQVLPEGLGRVPLIRESDKYPDYDVSENDVYSPMGVYLGDGVFHDLNGNLVLVPGAAFPDFVPQGATSIKVDNKWTPGYEITEKGDGLLVDGSMDQTITRHGDTVDVDGPLNADFRVTESGDRVRVDGAFGHDYDMTRQGDTIRVQGKGADAYSIKREGDTLHIDGPGDHDLTVRREGNTITVEGPKGRETRITRDGDTISVEGSGSNQTLRREGNAVRMDSSFFRGSRTVYGS